MMLIFWIVIVPVEEHYYKLAIFHKIEKTIIFGSTMMCCFSQCILIKTPTQPNAN